jgi:hypothetical protein
MKADLQPARPMELAYLGSIPGAIGILQFAPNANSPSFDDSNGSICQLKSAEIEGG